MGDQFVYSFKNTGILLYERDFYIVPGRTQWDQGALKTEFEYQAPANGPRRVDDLPLTLYNMFKSDIKPFLVVKFPDDVKRAEYLRTAWTDYDTGGVDWNAMYLNATIVDAVTGEKNYICLGDTVAYSAQIAAGTSLAGRTFLFAHRNIVQSMTAIPINTWAHPEQTIYIGDTNRGSGDEQFMYTSLGFNVTNEGSGPVVLKCFMKYSKAASITAPILEDNWGVKFTANTYGPQDMIQLDNCLQKNDPDSQYHLYTTVPDALKNLADCILRTADALNKTFQGFYVEETSLNNEVRTNNFMMALCNSDFPDPIIADYPKLCACLGRKGMNEALQQRFKDNRLRLVCQSADCLTGQRLGGVYTFVPSPPCSPINICDQTLQVEAASVNMQNMTFNCNFDSNTQSGLVPPALGTPPPPALPGLPGLPPPLIIPGLPAIAPAAGGDSSNVGVIAGSVVGGLFLVGIIILVIVLLLRRRR